ncbi:MAG TPA: cob(I)yrinic acid a,c-diamide adenosyltransferase [Acidimicrobiales bacterium]|nr:cob(I)yrinic acid a,c-diamide adenosyltransferase [Acidimicrobiales bacterium]
MKIYTRRGDDGTTSLRQGGRVRKDDLAIELVGTVDEAQAFLGLARAEAARGGWLDDLLQRIERDLWILMAEVTTSRLERSKLEPGATAVTQAMVELLELDIDRVYATLKLAPNFAVPGETRAAAQLDVARTVVRRAERLAVGLDIGGSHVKTYLNRLSDLVWTLARSQEELHPVQHRDLP